MGKATEAATVEATETAVATKGKAPRYDTGDYDVKRTDLHLADPFALKLDHGLNIMRGGKAPDHDSPEFQELARSLLPKDQGGVGQIQPIKVRMLRDRTLQVVAGFTRCEAMRHLKSRGFDVKIAFTIDTNMNDANALLINMVENIQRKAVKPLHEAMAVQTLMDVHGMKLPDIAAKIGKGVPHLQNMLNVLGMPEQIVQAVKDTENEVPGNTGITGYAVSNALVGLPDQEALKIFKEVEQSGERVTATMLRERRVKAIEAMREEAEKAAANGDGTPNAGVAAKAQTPRAVPPNPKTVRETFQTFTMEGTHPILQSWTDKAIMPFLRGEMSKENFLKRTAKVFKPEKVSTEEAADATTKAADKVMKQLESAKK